MKRELHVRFCESAGVRFPGATRPPSIRWRRRCTPSVYRGFEVKAVTDGVGVVRNRDLLSAPHLRHIRALLGVRESLVRTRVRWIVLIRSLLRREGYRVRNGQSSSFSERVGELELPQHFKREIAPLPALLGPLNRRIASLDRQLVEISRKDEVVKRLMTVPGVGPVRCAVCFVARLDHVRRFPGSSSGRKLPGARSPGVEHERDPASGTHHQGGHHPHAVAARGGGPLRDARQEEAGDRDPEGVG